GELVKQVRLAATDVENARARLEAVMRGHSFRDGTPASVVAVTAIAVTAVAVPVVVAPLPCDVRAFRLVMLDHTLNVVAFRRRTERLDEIELGHLSRERRPMGIEPDGGQVERDDV